MAGDFNVTAHPSESSNFNGSQVITSDMKEFNEATKQLTVFDHVFQGPIFTWLNRHQPDDFLSRKLDRVLINDQWLVQYPHSSVKFLPPKVSDHCPALVLLQ